eukprot:Skav202571  [mRNA]  locus=scaffold104:1450:20248:- [translate_table: standard]
MPLQPKAMPVPPQKKAQLGKRRIMAEENDVAAAAAGAGGGEDDAANWRRMQSRRKARGLAFLQDKFSAFHLLATLALATLLSRVTNLCFRFVNSDKTGIPRREEERARKRRRRMNAKGVEALAETDDDELQFDRVRRQAEKGVQLLWRELQGPLHYLVCADCFWPAGEPAQLKWEFLTENILRNVAALQWRILVKFEYPPWSLAHLNLPGCSDEEVEAAKTKFLDLEQCCLDPFWSKPLQQKVKTGALQFKRVVADYFASFRPVSLREEQNHVIQRYVSKERSKAVISCRQRAQTVVLNVKKNYESRGGRNLNVAKPRVAKAYKRVSKGKKNIFQRPRQLGSPMFYYINQRMRSQGGTWQQHKQAWEQMTIDKKRWWQDRHKNVVTLRRSQQRMAENWSEPDLPMSTSWNLGDSDWPVQSSLMSAFICQFQTKQVGIETLKKIEAVSADAQAYVQAVEAGATKYHFRDAMTLYCNHYMGDCVDERTVRSDETTQKAMAAEVPCMGCWSLHPGMCMTKHKDLKPAVAAFFKAVPKKSGVLQFQAGRVSQRHGRPGQPPQRASAEPSSSSCPAAGIDMSFFDAPHLLQPSGMQQPVFSDKAGFSGFDGNSHSSDEGELTFAMMHEEEEGFVSDGLLSDEDKPAGEVLPHGDRVVAMDSDNESAKSAGTTASGIKTVATDLQILRDCLGSRQTGLGVSGIMDRSKNDPEEMSNHEAILQSFKDSNYFVVWKPVDPSQANIPCSRARLHYLGVSQKLLPEGSAKSLGDELSNLWETLTKEAAKKLPKYRLDDFLYGSARDPSLLDVPSLKYGTEIARKDPGPAEEVFPKEGPQKKRRAASLQWPGLHQEMLGKYNATWLGSGFGVHFCGKCS